MVSRLFAFVLALALVWAGLGSAERHGAQSLSRAADTPPAATLVGAAAEAGSVEHHHLDDLPSRPQVQLDPLQEGAGLLPAAIPMAVAVAALAPPVPESLTPRAPYLEGPLRPPRGPAIVTA